MIVTPRIVLRLALIVFLAVLLQVGFFSQVPLLGSVANLLPVVVVAIGLLGGAVSGAVTGFAAGLLLDAMIGGTPGLASLSLMAAGYLAGRWREGYDIVSSLGWTWSESTVLLSTRTRPARSRISPRGAWILISRTRLAFASFRYASPERTCRNQRRKKIAAKAMRAIPPMIVTLIAN